MRARELCFSLGIWLMVELNGGEPGRLSTYECNTYSPSKTL
jgi:hypothetical protein